MTDDPKPKYTSPPTEPGRYWAREITRDMLDREMLSMAFLAEVVEGVPNPRGHRLLVKTGPRRPRYRSLNCYRWITAEEGTEDQRRFALQMSA